MLYNPMGIFDALVKLGKALPQATHFSYSVCTGKQEETQRCDNLSSLKKY